MNKTKTLLAAVAMALPMALMAEGDGQTVHTLFDHVTFYDGYRVQDFTAGVDSTPGVLHHTTYLYAKKLTDDVLDNIGETLSLQVAVHACCDNYDRLGNINLALVPKGQTAYSTDSVQRLELGRFITPFMNKNKEPSTCPYRFNANYLSLILRDGRLRRDYDLWLEYELFGVPYAAQQQVDGCEGRSDVFQGTLSLLTSQPALPTVDTDVLVPIHIKGPEWSSQRGINNYDSLCTDTLGKTIKTWTFTVPENCTDGQLVFVTSNHGSNSGGEEYERRWHYVYVDGELALTYRPGRRTCEPYRLYNTQSNGIYGTSFKQPSDWQTFSNWCPGNVIDNRIIHMGAVEAGEHSFTISVPDAVFAGSQGYFPVSVFFQGVTEGTVTAISDAVTTERVASVTVADGQLTITPACSDNVANVDLYDLQGRRLYHANDASPIALSVWPQQVLLVNIETADGIIETHKVLNR